VGVRLRLLIIDYWQIIAAIGACWFVVEHLHPDLILRDSTPTGGDTGLHIWSPDALRALLAEARLSGWSGDWFAGFPVFRFYMVVPTLFVVALDLVAPQNVAFKLVAAAGPALLPLAAWFLAREARLRDPAPALFAVATLPFLFDRFHVIWGGNIAASLAGEVGYSLSLTAGVVALGFVARGLHDGRFRAGAGAFLALAVLCHPIASLFMVVGWTALVATSTRPRWALRWSLLPGGLGLAVTAFWVGPFVWDRSLSVDLGWEPLVDVWATLTRLDAGSSSLQWQLGAAFVGVVAAAVRRHRTELALVATAGAFVVAVAVIPEGRLWNARLVPLWYLALHLVAALGVVALLRSFVLGESMLRPPANDRWSHLDPRALPIALGVAGVGFVLFAGSLGTVIGGAVLVMSAGELRSVIARRPIPHSLVPATVAVVVVVLVALALPLRSLPGGSTDTDGTYHWGPLHTTEQSFVPLWAAWNNEGYEAKVGDGRGGGWSEYEAIIATMAAIGEDRGCGRAMWEAGIELERYGSPGAMGLLPYWTDSCITSMEGLFFESSATSPFHFVNQVELSEHPSPALRGIDYPGFDPTAGFDHLGVWGVRYYLAFSPTAVSAAQGDPALTEVGASGPWRVFELADVALVEGAAYEPVVVTGIDRGNGWRDVALLGYLGRVDARVPLAADGPEEWTRVPADALAVGVGAVAQAPIEVSDLSFEDHRIAFSVDRIGAPVVVRSSWFPNWNATGADGPYRIAPNLMVVVPTTTEVELQYEARLADRVFQGISLVGVVGLAVLGRAQRPRPRCLAAR
jgi:hypothetical protein